MQFKYAIFASRFVTREDSIAWTYNETKVVNVSNEKRKEPIKSEEEEKKNQFIMCKFV